MAVNTKKPSKTLDPRPRKHLRGQLSREPFSGRLRGGDVNNHKQRTEAVASPLNTRFRKGFPLGFTAIAREGEPELDAGVDFGIYKLANGKTIEERHAKETAWLLMDGAAEIEFGGKKATVKRASLFDEAPTALHVPSRTPVRITAQSEVVEWAVARVENDRSFDAKLFLPQDSSAEYRGRGLAQGTCLRNVRLIFDIANRKESGMVLGEVITYPGRWSTYPPHYHAQPEIYHYRFTLPQGYGHGENGDEIYQVKQYDTLKILNCKGHSQVAAPGYGMYYIWVVRHLKNNPYTGFTYFPEHEWILNPKNQGWKPKEWESIQ